MIDLKVVCINCRSNAKRKATDFYSHRPSKIIRNVLQEQPEEQLEPNDIKSTAKAIYRRRRKTYPTLPKTMEETHEALQKMNIKTNKDEDFLLKNDPENGIIVFSTPKNLAFLCEVDEIFMDGTYKYCPKFFKQLYTLHGYRNGHYVPLVYILMNGKSSALYNTCLSTLINLCSEKRLTFEPDIVHVDFEEAMMKSLREVLPATRIKCCRFHLGKSCPIVLF